MTKTISKIKIQLEGRVIELSPQEARDLHKELNLLFDMQKTEFQQIQEEWDKTHPTPTPMPYPLPVFTIPKITYWSPWLEFYCEDRSTS